MAELYNLTITEAHDLLTKREVSSQELTRAVLDRICKLNEGPITNDSLRVIYREIMSSALSLEKSSPRSLRSVIPHLIAATMR